MTWRQQAGNFDTPINPEYEQEARLVDQARAGSERAFSALLARYQQPVFRLIFYLVGDADEARELARVALKHSLTRMPRVPAGYSVRPWLLRVATLVALDAVRERSESPQALIASLQLPPAPQQSAPRIVDADPTLSETMELSITRLEENPEAMVADAWDRLPIDVERELVRRLLANLPENDAELLALGVVGQVPTRDLAAISGTSQRSIRRRIARALILFQSHYQMVRQETLPPAPPTKELDPGNISAVMAINVARRGLNEATERMRRSWHNVRASLGTVEAQESLQTLRDEDAPAATQSRPLTAPGASPSAKRTRPTERITSASSPTPTPPVAPAAPVAPVAPARPPRPTPTEPTIILPTPPVATPKSEPERVTADTMSATEQTQAAALEGLAIAMKGRPDTPPGEHSVAVPADPEPGAPAAMTPPASDRHASTESVPPSDDAAILPVSATSVAEPHNIMRDEHADAAPEQQTTIRQLPRFGPPAEAAAPLSTAAESAFVAADTSSQAADETLSSVAESRADEELVDDAPLAADTAIPMPASADETTLLDVADTTTLAAMDIADVTSEADRASDAIDLAVVADDGGVTASADTSDVTAEVGALAKNAAPTTDVFSSPQADVAISDEVAALPAAATSSGTDDALVLLDDTGVAAMTPAYDDRAGDTPAMAAVTTTDGDAPAPANGETDETPAAPDMDLTAPPPEDTPDAATAAIDVEAASVAVTAAAADAPQALATADEDVADHDESPRDTDSTPDEAPSATVPDSALLTETAIAPDEAIISANSADEPLTEDASPAVMTSHIADKDATTTEAQTEAEPMQDEEAAQTEEAAAPVPDALPPYIARQEERTMPVSRHFGDTIVIRDDARLEYVSRHQGNPVDLSDLNGIAGVAFSEQAEDAEAEAAPTRPPAAGVMNIIPEATRKDEDRFTTLAQSDPDATIVAKPIAQPAREEITALTQSADLADLAGIMSQMTQIRRPPSDDAPTSPATAPRPRRLTRPMPRLDRDAPEPPSEEP